MTPQVRRDVLVDRAMFRLVTSRAAQPPDAAVLERVGDEVREALLLFEKRGWLADPASYHEAPPPPEGVREKRVRRSTAISWDDAYQVRPEEPGAERFAGYTANRIARATLLEHRSGDRPWVICIHGFGMGTPAIDLRGFRAEHLYRDLGLNLAFLTLPFHGRRRAGRTALPRFPGVEVLDNVHGLAQAVWDARQLLRYIQERSTQPVSVMGLSLGGGVAALTASLEDVHSALLLIPLVDLASLITDTAELRGMPVTLDEEATEGLKQLLRPVSPLALAPKVPLEKRFIVAGTLDQFVRPSTQAVALWHHWDEPAVHWYHGGHVSLFWNPRARSAIDHALLRMAF